MKTLYIFIEKMSMLEHALTQLSNKEKKYKDFEKKLLSYDEIKVFNLFGFGLYTFKLPSKIKYKNYPYIKEKEYKRITKIGKIDIENYIPEKYNDNLYIRYNIKYTKLSDYQEALNKTQNVDFLIYVDCDATGVNIIDRLLNDYCPQWRNKINNIYINLFMKFEDIFNVFKTKNDFIKYDRIKKIGNIKFFFDYNYMINSMIFFKEILNNTQNKEDIYMSKYTVLTLHLIWKEYKNKSFRFVEILQKMENKFKIKDSYIGNIGTPISGHVILSNILQLNIFDEISKERYIFNEKSEAFISLFHKKTFDPYIISRLENWKTLKEDEAKEKISKYLLDIFKCQKKKNNYLK